MDLNDINSALIEKDLPRLERHFFRTYRGQVPDMDTYNISLNDAFRMKDVKYGKVRHVIFDETIGKYKYMNQHSPERVRRKLLIIDAILTIKHYNRLEKEKSIKDNSPFSFDVVQQLMEVA